MSRTAHRRPRPGHALCARGARAVNAWLKRRTARHARREPVPSLHEYDWPTREELDEWDEWDALDDWDPSWDEPIWSDESDSYDFEAGGACFDDRHPTPHLEAFEESDGWDL